MLDWLCTLGRISRRDNLGMAGIVLHFLGVSRARRLDDVKVGAKHQLLYFRIQDHPAKENKKSTLDTDSNKMPRRPPLY